MSGDRQWRVTKYDPALRDRRDAFRGDDWSRVGDIGETFGGQRLDVAQYLATEDRYVAAALGWYAAARPRRLEARGIERYDAPPEAVSRAGLDDLLVAAEDLRDRNELDSHGVELVVRANLRELICCRMVDPAALFIHFGEELYMFVGTRQPLTAAVQHARAQGLFVEPRPSPYRTTDEASWPG